MLSTIEPVKDIRQSSKARAFPPEEQLSATTMRTNSAMRSLIIGAINTVQIVRQAEIARAYSASKNHLGLVVNELSQSDFLNTVRGKNGGVTISHLLSGTCISDVARTFKASCRFAECFEGGENECRIVDQSRLRNALGRAVGAIYAELNKVYLSDLTKGNAGLTQLLELSDA